MLKITLALVAETSSSMCRSGEGEPGAEAEVEVPRPGRDQLHHVHHRGGDGGGQPQPAEQSGDHHRIVA